MLEHFDEVLLEQYIISEGMTKIERDICMLYITNIKDIVDSDLDTENRRFKINTLRLKKGNNCVFFEGEVFNENESRDIMGSLAKSGKNMKVECVFKRPSGEYYKTIDTFRKSNTDFIRKTSYVGRKRQFEDFVVLNINDLNKKYEDRIMHLKRV